MNLTTTWNNSTPSPSCGYILSYRRKGDSVYTTIATSGSTQSTSLISVFPKVPANYEGFVQSNCCNGNLSLPDNWGVNTYSLLQAAVTVRVSPYNFILNLTTQYANPYPTLVTGSFITQSSSTLTYSQTFPANSTSVAITLPQTPGQGESGTLPTTINTIGAIFNNGGQLQQFDAINTPAYFEYISSSGQTSGTTSWFGSPLVLPSFTLDSFSVTELNMGGSPIAGNLLFSWVQRILFNSGTIPYNVMTFNIAESDNLGVILGTVHVSLKNGLTTATITFNKGMHNISPSTQYAMSVFWNDGTQPATGNRVSFYLPTF